MKVLLGGTDPLADGIAEFLQQLEWTELVGLVGTKGPAIDRAKTAGIPVVKPSGSLSGEPDIFLAAELPAKHHLKWSESARLGGLHIHLSLLPTHRGVDPIRWGLLSGDPSCGATVHYITEEPYCGNILAQEKVDIKPAYDATELDEILRGTARDMVVKVLHALAKIGPLPGTPQRTEETSEHDVPPDAARCAIDFSQPMETVHRTIQAFCEPHGGARCNRDGAEVLIWKSLPLVATPPPGANPEMITGRDFKGAKSPGTLLAGPEGRMAVRCGCGGELELLEVQGEVGAYAPIPLEELLADTKRLDNG